MVHLHSRCEVLTDSLRPRKYWNALKTKLKAEGSEPFKQRMAQLGRERLKEIDDPKQGIERLMEHGYGNVRNQIEREFMFEKCTAVNLPLPPQIEK